MKYYPREELKIVESIIFFLTYFVEILTSNEIRYEIQKENNCREEESLHYFEQFIFLSLILLK